MRDDDPTPMLGYDEYAPEVARVAADTAPDVAPLDPCGACKLACITCGLPPVEGCAAGLLRLEGGIHDGNVYRCPNRR